MTHGDQKGLVLPPNIAPIQVVIIPIFKAGIDNSVILAAARTILEDLKKDGVRAIIDDEEGKTPGSKFFKWELKGVPVRIELQRQGSTRNRYSARHPSLPDGKFSLRRYQSQNRSFL
jgi:prolyl-tRNA synthetase